MPPPEYLPTLRELCDRHGILLVADEIQSGFGRTGKMFACEHWGVEPDILCLGKGIASGMPLGAMVARSEISTWTPGAHGSTFGGNPVACAAALATIGLIEQGLVSHAADVGSYLKQRLEELQASYSVMIDVRGLGLMIGVELVAPEGAAVSSSVFRDNVVNNCFDEGLLLLGCGESTIRFCPPLVVSRDDVDPALRVFETALRRAMAAEAVPAH